MKRPQPMHKLPHNSRKLLHLAAVHIDPAQTVDNVQASRIDRKCQKPKIGYPVTCRVYSNPEYVRRLKRHPPPKRRPHQRRRKIRVAFFSQHPKHFLCECRTPRLWHQPFHLGKPEQTFPRRHQMQLVTALVRLIQLDARIARKRMIHKKKKAIALRIAFADRGNKLRKKPPWRRRRRDCRKDSSLNLEQRVCKTGEAPCVCASKTATRR